MWNLISGWINHLGGSSNLISALEARGRKEGIPCTIIESERQLNFAELRPFGIQVSGTGDHLRLRFAHPFLFNRVEEIEVAQNDLEESVARVCCYFRWVKKLRQMQNDPGLPIQITNRPLEENKVKLESLTVYIPPPYKEIWAYDPFAKSAELQGFSSVRELQNYLIG